MQNCIEKFDEERHTPIIYAAALEGVDISPTVGGERYIGFGNTKYGYGPACIVDDAGTQHVAEPHVTWFPWTSAADKIVNFKWAMNFFGKDRQVLLNVQKDQIEFFEHFVKRGFLRKVGFISDLPIVDEIHMYQYTNKEKDA